MRIDGRFCRELLHPTFGRMQPQLQRIERQTIVDRNRELAVENEAPQRQSAQCRDHLGEIARQRFARFRL